MSSTWFQAKLNTPPNTVRHFPQRVLWNLCSISSMLSFKSWIVLGLFKTQLDDLNLATAPTARNSMQTVREAFPEHIMYRFGDIAWPPRPPDLSACDFFLLGYSQQKMFVKRPNAIQDLKDNVRADTARIPQDTLREVTHSVRRRVEFYLKSGGAHLNDTIFKKWPYNMMLSFVACLCVSTQ
jgi:hypothetical protein